MIRPGAIGDCILCFPALEYLAEGNDTEIWIPTPLVSLVPFAGRVRSLASTGLDLVGLSDTAISTALQDCLRSFDAIVSWYGSNRPEFRAALTSMNPNCTFHTALPPSDWPGHAADYFLQQVTAPLGAVSRIESCPDEFRGSAILHPFSGSACKNWRLSSFHELAASVSQPIEWCAGPEERLPGATRFDNLRDLANWIAGASIYIGNDSGITHLAAATGVRTVALFGPTSPKLWAPRGSNVTVLKAEPLETLSAAEVARTIHVLTDAFPLPQSPLSEP